MARTRTGTELIADVRALADIEGATGRHSDASLLRHINQSIAAYRDMVSSWGADWYLARAALTLTSGSRTATIAGTPAIARVVMVSFTETTSGSMRRLEALSLDAEDEILSAIAGTPFGYRWEAQTLRLYPMPASAGTGELIYLPAWTDIAAGGTFDGVNGGEDWVVTNSAYRVAMRDMDKDRIGIFTTELENLNARIRRLVPPQSMHRENTRGRRECRRMRWTT